MAKEKKAGDSGRGTARRPSKLERTAYHEAGHAVAAYEMRLPFTRVSIVSDQDDGSSGRCTFSRLAYRNLHPDWDSSDRTRLRLERLIICYLAGYAAEAKHSGRNSWVRLSHDGSEVLDMALYVVTDEEKELHHYLNWQWERTKNLFLIQHGMLWAAVEALASELLQRREIGGRKAREIIREAIQFYVHRRISERARKSTGGVRRE